MITSNTKCNFSKKNHLNPRSLRSCFIKPLTASSALFITLFSVHAISKPFSFALIGDTPYGVKAHQVSPKFNKLVEEINADDSLSWVIHIGDIKTGASPCSDAFLEDRKRRFDKIKLPFVLTPGDNEWTDCHRHDAGGFDPLNRLSKLRELFFSSPNKALAQTANWVWQQPEKQKQFTEFPENLIWKKHDIVFATIHIVGSADGTAAFSKLSPVKRTKAHDEEVKQRQKAALAWLTQAFVVAKNENAAGIFIAIHGNPGLDKGMSKRERKAFKNFRKMLRTYTENYSGQVVLAHGDTHTHRIDRPKLGKKFDAKNFIRVETHGDSNSAWIKVNVHPSTEDVFSFEVTP